MENTKQEQGVFYFTKVRKEKTDEYRKAKEFANLMDSVEEAIVRELSDLEHQAKQRETDGVEHMCTPDISLPAILKEHGLIIQDPRSKCSNTYLITDRGRKIYGQIKDSFDEREPRYYYEV